MERGFLVAEWAKNIFADGVRVAKNQFVKSGVVMWLYKPILQQKLSYMSKLH